MNKICTSIEQSQKLIKLGIDVNTADMCWQNNEFPIGFNDDDAVPAWSLAALLNVLPEGMIENYYAPNLQKEEGKYSIAYGNEKLLCIADNPIDCCVKMIIKLNELKLL